MPRLPSDAFQRFLDLGPGRSYAKLAATLGCSKRSITACATRGGWQARLREVEAAARQRTEERAVEDLAAIDGRHLRLTRAIQGRALEALRNMPMTSAAAAVRALDVSVRLERKILGVPEDHSLIEAQEGISPELADSLIAAARAADEQRKREAATAPAPPPVGRPSREPGAN